MTTKKATMIVAMGVTMVNMMAMVIGLIMAAMTTSSENEGLEVTTMVVMVMR